MYVWVISIYTWMSSIGILVIYYGKWDDANCYIGCIIEGVVFRENVSTNIWIYTNNKPQEYMWKQQIYNSGSELGKFIQIILYNLNNNYTIIIQLWV